MNDFNLCDARLLPGRRCLTSGDIDSDICLSLPPTQFAKHIDCVGHVNKIMSNDLFATLQR